ncbi:hypothetical protein [Streptomyces ipomoeae]|uniref:hypothetical protein n=1 Tax=Streptomyces ipomoeae TaxID=103232 RepID=UPI0029ACBCBF|nr:hypothetical protein [Streptomyces ipomoeae]MDX2697155.1 hypothetical protein [Streptomyces ipomoeae]MDX2843065.1 hypothetical protein [Streptomyces ipomoeae]
MRTIVAGRIVASQTEYFEAAFGFGVDFDALRDATPQLKADFVEFLEDSSDPASEIDRENIAYFRRALRVRRAATVVPLPRRGTAPQVETGEVRAA